MLFLNALPETFFDYFYTITLLTAEKMLHSKHKGLKLFLGGENYKTVFVSLWETGSNTAKLH